MASIKFDDCNLKMFFKFMMDYAQSPPIRAALVRTGNFPPFMATMPAIPFDDDRLEDLFKQNGFNGHFDYVEGIPLKFSYYNGELHGEMFDRDYGTGEFMKAVKTFESRMLMARFEEAARAAMASKRAATAGEA